MILGGGDLVGGGGLGDGGLGGGGLDDGGSGGDGRGGGLDAAILFMQEQVPDWYLLERWLGGWLMVEL